MESQAVGLPEQPAAERIDEDIGVDLVTQQEVARHADAAHRDTDPATGLQGDDSQRDRDAETTVEYMIEQRIPRVVVVDEVAGKSEVDVEMFEQRFQQRRGARMGDLVETPKAFLDVE